MRNFTGMDLQALFIQSMSFKPTSQQEAAFAMLEKFLRSGAGDECFVLRGYAGTGKTTIISSLVKALPKMKMQTVLLAPTGRAAKVITHYSGKKAFTIHKRIYRKKSALSLDMSFVLAPNLSENTLFIVDEASMISDDPGDFGRHSLLQDLLSYVYNGKNCRLMLVGDTAQLPPVGSLHSPALSIDYLKNSFALTLFTYELTDVMRQEKSSGILYNATQLRQLVRNSKAEFPKFHTRGFKDIYQMNGGRLSEGLEYAYNKFGIENTLMVCRSNKSANNYNQQIRNRILYREEELTGGDYVMVVRNNYFWLGQEENVNAFIANGDIAKVRKVRNVHEMYGFRFADAVLEFTDYPDEEPLHCKVLLDTLYAEAPSLSPADGKRLYEAVMEDYIHIPDKKQRMQELKSDPFYNALQIKFSFAVTCHKAQGGQWDAVFVDQGFLTEEMVNEDFLRWLYTAVTRASCELFLVNFSEKFFTEPI